MTCPHGIYGDGWGCQQCHPAGTDDDDGAVPVLPRSSGDPLTQQQGALECCSKCGAIRTYSAEFCHLCSQEFPHDEVRARGQTIANRRVAGRCPECLSTIHYETDKKTVWECSDCGALYTAPRMIEE